MEYSKLNLPIFHETFDIIDSTKISTFASCPRHFFFEYILGWREDKPNIHLGFGSAIHEALEYLMNCQDGEQVGYSADQAMRAIELFNQKFDEIFSPSEMDGIDMLAGIDVTNGAKDKSNAANAIIDYAKWYRNDNFRTIETERAGTVYLGGDRLIYAKLDSIIEDKNGIYSLEHKTTGRKTGAWLNDWGLKVQLGTYTQLLRTTYGPESKGIKINGMILRAPTKSTGKANNEFLRIPVILTEEMLSMWLWEVNYQLDLLDLNMQWLSKTKASDPVMQAFPRNPSSCSKNFNGCPFSALCGSWSNPIAHLGEMPTGMHVERWDPRSHSTVVDP